MEEKNIKKQNMRKRIDPELMYQMKQILIRIVFLLVVTLIMTVIVFGIYRVPDDSMSPGMKAGDLVLVYRLDKNYLPRDLVLLKQDGEKQIRRVIATEDDKLEISEDGLIINGRLQSEQDIYEETLAYEEGIKFPVTLDKEEIFLLADARKNASDSRYYGPIKVSETEGMVIAVLRHNGL